jgi:hypothetical protein
MNLRVDLTALAGFDQCLFENLMPAIRAFCRLFQNVIRHARIGSGNAVEDVIEWNLGVLLIAVPARLDQPLGLAESCGLDKHTTTCCSGVGSKKSPDIGIGF